MSLIVRPGLEIPDADLEVAFVRSSGPGGQNVNKVASAVQLRFALERNTTLHDDVKARLRALAGQRVTDAGELLIIARESRSQEQNRRARRGALARSGAPRADRAEETACHQTHARVTRAAAGLQGAHPEEQEVARTRAHGGLRRTMAIVWRERFLAFAIHFVLTLAVGRDAPPR